MSEGTEEKPLTENPASTPAKMMEILERVEGLMEDRKAIGKEIQDEWRAARRAGFDDRALKALINLRAMPDFAREQHTNSLDAYRQATGLG